MFSVSDIEGFNLEVPLKRYFLPSLQWLMIAVFYVDQLRHTWVFLIAWSWGRQKGWASWGSEIHVESKESRPTHIIGYWSLVPYNRMDKWWSGNHQSKVFSAITTKQSSFIRLILRLSLSLIFFYLHTVTSIRIFWNSWCLKGLPEVHLMKIERSTCIHART